MPLYSETWSSVWPQTGTRQGSGQKRPARYHPRLSIAEIRDLEMSTVSREFEVDCPKDNERHYVRDVGDIVGASNQKQTNYILVKRHQSGPVHGYPVTVEELRRKGVSV